MCTISRIYPDTSSALLSFIKVGGTGPFDARKKLHINEGYVMYYFSLNKVLLGEHM